MNKFIVTAHGKLDDINDDTADWMVCTNHGDADYFAKKFIDRGFRWVHIRPCGEAEAVGEVVR